MAISVKSGADALPYHHLLPPISAHRSMHANQPDRSMCLRSEYKNRAVAGYHRQATWAIGFIYVLGKKHLASVFTVNGMTITIKSDNRVYDPQNLP